jgi:hypothetical protein
MDLARSKTSKTIRAKSYGLPAPKRNESIRGYARRLGVSFYKARYVVEGKRYEQTKSERKSYLLAREGRIEGMLKRFRDLYGDFDTRFNGDITPATRREFEREIIDKYDLALLDNSRAYRKKLSPGEQARVKRTTDFFQIPERRFREIYVGG